MERRKVYVTVSAVHSPDGKCRPVSILMANDRIYPIDKVLQVCRSYSEVGGRGVRYRVRIGTHETCLFEEANGRWFVEAKFG